MFVFSMRLTNVVVLCCQIFIANTLECPSIELQNNEIFISSNQRAILLERESNDFENLDEFSDNLVKFAFKISINESEQVLSAILIDRTFNDSKLMKWLCNLIKSQSYDILCMTNFGVEYKNQVGIQEIMNLKLRVQVEPFDFCQQLFYRQLSDFWIFCYSQDRIKIYSVDMMNITTLLASQDMKQNQIELCKRDIIKQSEEQIFIFFYGCYEWGIFKFSGLVFDLLLNQIMIFQQLNQSIPYVENIQICNKLKTYSLSTFYLITKEGYYLYRVDYQTDLKIFFEFFEFSLNIKKLIISKVCVVNFLVINKDFNIFIVNPSNSQFMNIESSSLIQAHQTSNLIFILNTNGLEVIFNQKIRQTKQIYAQQLFFLEGYNFFYQIEEFQHEIYFYTYQEFNSYLIPSKQYIFELFSYDIFKISKSFCYKVQYKNSNDINTIITDIELQNKCQIHEQVQFNKQNIALPLHYQLQLLNDNANSIINITESFDFKQICIKQYFQTETVLLYFENNQVLLKNNEFIIIQDCDNYNRRTISIRSCQVFHYQFNILLVREYDLYYRIFYQQKQQWLVQKISTSSQIIKVMQFQDSVLVLTENADIIFINLNDIRSQKLSRSLSKMLYQIFNSRKASNQINESEYQFFYSNQKGYIYISFFGYFLIYDQNDDFLRLLTLNNIDILSIQRLITNVFQILAIHRMENMIIQYFLTGSQKLNLQYNYTLNNTQIVKPLKFYIEKLLIILVKSNSSYQLQLFSLSKTKTFKLIKIIQIGRPEFFIMNQILYYYEENLVIKGYDLFSITIKFENQLIAQNNAFQNLQLAFNLVSKDGDDKVINCVINLNYYNFCQKIFPIDNEIKIYLRKQTKQILRISDLFIGPIDQLFIKNNSKIEIKGLQQQNEPLQLCQQFKQMDCIIQVQVDTNLFSNQKKQFYLYILKHKKIKTLLPISPDISRELKLLNLFLINKWQLAFILDFEQKVIIKVYQINTETFTLSQNKIFEYNSNCTSTNLNFYQVEDIIQLQFQFKDILFFTPTFKFIKQNQKAYQQGIIFVQDSNQLYVEFQIQNQDFIIKIFQYYSNNKFKKINQILIPYYTFYQELLKHFNNQFTSKESTPKNYSLKSIKKGETITLLVLLMFKHYSLIIDIKFGESSSIIDFKITKILRNPDAFIEQYKVVYKSNILFLSSDLQNHYFYDLTHKEGLYNYQHLKSNKSILIYPVNNTHLIFYDDYSSITIGQLHYEIQLHDTHINKQTCILIAENSLSKSEIHITIIRETEWYNHMLMIMIIIIIITFLILICFIKIIRRNDKNLNISIELKISKIQL
ncbi:unnamed protein product [Paramecium primaurelia]|uniref:Transmembrane protein n=1 Tax=Paramecium primaurelia TaxID=5886 RepID=A0A8S1KBS3_PARPR|nr:unnamed protein product [Paramecium primaurelia]